MAITEAPTTDVDTATDSDETLALPSGGGPVELPRARGVSNVAAALFVAGDFMVLCALVAAYYGLRAEAFVWPPPGAHLGTYLPTMIAGTMVLSAVTIQWAVWAIRRDDQRTTLIALTFTIFFALAILNGQWYELAHLNFGVGRHFYGTFVYVLTGYHMAHVIAAIVVLIAVLVRNTGGEFTADEHDTITAAAIFWQFVNIAGLFAYAVLFLHP